MDYEKVKLRSDLDALAGRIGETVAVLSARVETLERHVAEEAAAKAAADAKVAAEAKALEEARAVAEAKATEEAKVIADAAAAKAAKRPFGLKAKT